MSECNGKNHLSSGNFIRKQHSRAWDADVAGVTGMDQVVDWFDSVKLKFVHSTGPLQTV